MSTAKTSVVETAAAEQPQSPTYDEATKALRALQRTTSEMDWTADRADDRETVHAFMDRWVVVAEARLRGAEGSPADLARWRDLIGPLRRPGPDTEKAGHLVLLYAAARRLLQAVREAARPGPSVQEVGRRLREGISSGEYAPGRPLGVKRLAVDVGLTLASVVRVETALSDLAAEGAVIISPSNKARVAGTEHDGDRALHIAAWLRMMVAKGVYPPGSRLPRLPELCAALLVPQSVVSQALHVLHHEGTITAYRGARSTVRSTLPFPAASPPELETLLVYLRTKAMGGAVLSHSAVREAARNARGWWIRRLSPHPETLESTTRALVAAAARLIWIAQDGYADDADALAVLRWTAETALADAPSIPHGRLWRTACLGVAVLHVLRLVEEDAEGDR
ncbi:GntR family transcriptional regulator [Streptomyces sp. PTY087I2]|uniref:GntR family transcriptional regulator n=1 Tax=Streptomyces sp. PTY087I2 TaxID=1819298 RepID=UPI00080B34BB|nr:GntR family transcriptional regulator [Streptomyces sp. PTY087I2]OCC13990.1 Bacterial regulatory protein, gntR family [Streptomyces sp. PTY087I2]